MVADAEKCLQRVKDSLLSDASFIDELDGLSMSLKIGASIFADQIQSH